MDYFESPSSVKKAESVNKSGTVRANPFKMDVFRYVF